jgi:hypothetical protein
MTVSRKTEGGWWVGCVFDGDRNRGETKKKSQRQGTDERPNDHPQPTARCGYDNDGGGEGEGGERAEDGGQRRRVEVGCRLFSLCFFFHTLSFFPTVLQIGRHPKRNRYHKVFLPPTRPLPPDTKDCRKKKKQKKNVYPQ